MAQIVVKGDVSVDWYRVPVPEHLGANENWRLSEGSQMLVLSGGALLLADMVQAAVGKAREIQRQTLSRLRLASPARVIRSHAELAAFPRSVDKKDQGKLVYRVKREFGFEGPKSGRPPCPPLDQVQKDSDTEIVVLDDAGNGFRDMETVEWPSALSKPGQEPIVIYKTCRPLAQGRLWQHLLEHHRQHLITIVTVNDLRAHGLHVSRRLSWDRSAIDFARQLAHHDTTSALCQSRYLIVTLGMDGALIHSNNNGESELKLIFDSQRLEDDFHNSCPGRMFGVTTAFTAALISRIKDKDLQDLESGVKYGLRSSRHLLQLGFGSQLGHLGIPSQKIFTPPDIPWDFASTTVPLASGDDQEGKEAPSPENWTILSEVVGHGYEVVACDQVRTGSALELLDVPTAQFGKLKTVDRSEIESFQSIRNLMREYLTPRAPARPLSIAVFGPPGAGKSFGVTEVAKSMDDPRIEKHAFNVAQFTCIDDLITAFHSVRDLAIAGKIPLVFFDEFDSSFKDTPLGWLKYFLAPMQDGEFKHGEQMHPIGQAIFVFAGGTAHTLEAFCRETRENEQKEKDVFIANKGPDFVSRLRGHVNILGLDQQDDDDKVYKLRRAILLRAMLEFKASHLIDSKGNCRIDQGILSAFINTPRFNHGARSLEAILDMSLLSEIDVYEPSALPSKRQLAMHVDSEYFMAQVIKEANWAAKLEQLSQAVHRKYVENQQGRKDPGDPSMQPWDQLPPDLQESNRQQAADLPAKLRVLGYGIRPAQGRPKALTLSEEQIELLAQMEHQRWSIERLHAGWRYGPERDPVNKVSPYLVSWDELVDLVDSRGNSIQENDREAVRNIPDLLKMTNFEVYELK